MTALYGSLSAYLNDVGKVDLLTAAEEVDLGRLVHAGDTAARERFIRANLPLVTWVAKKYRGLGLSLDDLIQEGSLGLLTAIDMFDPEAEIRFGTYATWWIRQAIQRGVMNFVHPIRVPIHVLHLIGKTDEDIVCRLPGNPVESRTAESLAKSINRIRNAERIVGMTRWSLNVRDNRGRCEYVTDAGWAIDPGHSPDEMAEDAEESTRGLARLTAAINALDPREQQVIRENYGLGGCPIRSLAVIARDMGLSRQRVQQLKDQALNKIKANLQGRPARATAAEGETR